MEVAVFGRDAVQGVSGCHLRWDEAVDITKAGVPGSLQSLVIIRALTMRISIFSLLASFSFRFFGSLNVILVSIQSMLRLCQASQS